ncbi:hypothetical protein [Helicobacter muridarum]|uniref:hypothetical protein n=1 Tax=Helicobacter muridarum TaxID=216 RepID=UPI000E0FE77A|nr:hypothetical protein [Helicobacter muridarum]
MLLKDYKPTYITNTTKTLSVKPLEDNKENIILGGAGSLAACSLFSASFGVMRIVYYLLGIESKELDTRGGGENTSLIRKLSSMCH